MFVKKNRNTLTIHDDDFNCTPIKCLHNGDLNVLAKNMFDLGTSSNSKGLN